ncbi:MAG: hypothetical protein HY650_12105 [Acidobacteria bacterium]|nr:hypothetical protein [Acidobacteriota bacterium]
MLEAVRILAVVDIRHRVAFRIDHPRRLAVAVELVPRLDELGIARRMKSGLNEAGTTMPR